MKSHTKSKHTVNSIPRPCKCQRTGIPADITKFGLFLNNQLSSSLLGILVFGRFQVELLLSLLHFFLLVPELLEQFGIMRKRV